MQRNLECGGVDNLCGLQEDAVEAEMGVGHKSGIDGFGRVGGGRFSGNTILHRIL